jgi:hypothetical protein
VFDLITNGLSKQAIAAFAGFFPCYSYWLHTYGLLPAMQWWKLQVGNTKMHVGLKVSCNLSA